MIAYCIMDNHAHILIQADRIKDIETWMKKSNVSYAIYYNKINNRVGYVFRNRYKAQPIKNEKHLYLCIDYIHNNPVKAKICKSKEKYIFSSYTQIYQGNQIKLQKMVEKMLERCITQTEDKANDIEEFKLEEDEKENKEEICKEVVKSFLEDKKIEIQDLKKEKQYLKEIVNILKYKNKISYRIMEKCLEISREKLRMLIVDER